jgi:hypothetical protein
VPDSDITVLVASNKKPPEGGSQIQNARYGGSTAEPAVGSGD